MLTAPVFVMQLFHKLDMFVEMINLAYKPPDCRKSAEENVGLRGMDQTHRPA
jgi:hypothetical protein